MNEKTREPEEQRVAEQLKHNFSGLDPWIPARPPLGSVVPRYEEATEVGTIKVSFGGKRTAAPVMRTPRTALALLAAAVVLAVGVASAPLFLRSTGPVASGPSTQTQSAAPSASAAASGSMAPTPSNAPSASPSSSPGRTPGPAQATDVGGGIARLFAGERIENAFTSKSGTYVALTVMDGDSSVLIVIDQQGRELDRWPWTTQPEFTWIDDSSFLVVEGVYGGGLPSRQVLRGSVGDRNLQPIASVDKVCAIVGGGGRMALVKDPTGVGDAASCNRYEIVGQGEPVVRDGVPQGFSPDGSRLAILTSPDPVNAKFVITDLQGNGILTAADLAYYQGTWPVFAFSPDGRYVAYPRSVGDGKPQHVSVADAVDGHRLMDVEAPGSEQPMTEISLGWIWTNSVLVRTANYNPRIKGWQGVFDLTGRQLEDAFPRQFWTTSVAGDVASWSGDDGTIILAAYATGPGSRTFPGKIVSAYWSADGNDLYVITSLTDATRGLFVIRGMRM